MKKIYGYLLIVLAGISLLAGCYKDKGNYNYSTLDTFYVDSTKIPEQFIVSQYATLQLPSNLVYNGDKSKLKYTWTTYLQSPGLTGNPATVLGTSEELSAPIALLPDTYWLEFSAVDPSNGRRASHRYLMKVESVGAGMMVLHEINGRVECDLIKTRLLEGLRDNDEVIRNLYSLANPDKPLTGKAVGIGMYKSSNIQHINIYTDNEGYALSPADMRVSKSFNEQFFVTPAVKQPQGYFVPYGLTTTDFESSSGFEFLVNGGKLYTNMILFAFGRPSFYSLMTAAGDYTAAPFPLYGLGRIVVYDQKNGRMLGAGPFSTALTPIVSNGTAFNFQSIGKEMLSISYGFGGAYMVYGIFRNTEDDGKRFIYVMDLGSSTARYVWDISSLPAISGTKLFTTGTRGQLMYYAAGNKVYRIKFDLNAGTMDGAEEALSFIPAGEEITYLKLCPHPGRNVPENAKDKYLFIGTFNNATGKGKVYMAQANVTSGALLPEPVAVFEDFGKVKDMAFKF